MNEEADRLTDECIRDLEAEAERASDTEWVSVCRLAYRDSGRGNCHPVARGRIVRLLRQRYPSNA